MQQTNPTPSLPSKLQQSTLIINVENTETDKSIPHLQSDWLHEVPRGSKSASTLQYLQVTSEDLQNRHLCCHHWLRMYPKEMSKTKKDLNRFKESQLCVIETDSCGAADVEIKTN